MLWIKAFHIIFMVCWFAGIFYLPRLFVYHSMTEHEKTANQLLVMERKLYRFTTPFMFLTIGFGFWLAYYNLNYYLSAGWFHTKLTLVFVLVGYHFHNGMIIKGFVQGIPPKSHVFYRWYNEAPVLVLFGAVILAVLKPF